MAMETAARMAAATSSKRQASTDSDRHEATPHKNKEAVSMDRPTDEELKSHLIQTNEEFRRLSIEHSDYDHRLTDLENRYHLTDEEQLEEVRLKKLKLHHKDRMTEIMREYLSHQVV
jgi:uncharacterized protein YdcH (DUF465 family)